MKIVKCICTILLLFFISKLEAKEYDISDYGVRSWSFENASPIISKIIEDAKADDSIVLKFPGGRVDLWPEGAAKRELYISNSTENDDRSKVKTIGLLFEGMKNITIEGNNTLIVLHGKMISMAFIKCTNVKVNGISFDYEVPTMAELEILELSDSKVKTRLNPTVNYIIKDKKAIFYGEGWRMNHYHAIACNPTEKTMKYSSWEPFNRSSAVETVNHEITFSGNFERARFNEGDVLTVRDPYRDNCGAFINLSKNVMLNNVTMNYMHGMGIVSQFSENITFNRVSVVPRKNSRRNIAAFADCFHFSGCRGEILLDGCYTSGSHDDPVNVHGTHLRVKSISDDGSVIVRFMHHQTYGFPAFFSGDTVGFVNHKTLLLKGKAVVRNAKMINKREMELTFEIAGTSKFVEGDAVENITWTPMLTVRNCHFEKTNTRGLLVTTRRKVIIEYNTFYRVGMHAILIADDCNNWYESGPVKDVTIRNNKFIQCGYNQGRGGYVICIKPEIPKFKRNRYVHSNIRITENEFQCFSQAVLYARSVDGLLFKNNSISFAPFEENDNKALPELKIEHCNSVDTSENKYIDFDGNL